MKHILLITLLLSLGCSSTQRQNRQLRLSKLHLLKAQALGAKMDSVKTQVKENITVSGIHDEESKNRYVNVNALDSLCMELRRQLDSVVHNSSTTDNIWNMPSDYDSYDTIINGHKATVERSRSNKKNRWISYSGKWPLTTSSKIQKLVCPDVIKDTTFNLYVTVQNKKYDLPIHIVASSIAGTASLSVDSKNLTIQYAKETIQVNATPANMPTFTGKLLRGAVILLVGVVIGFILKMFLKFGV